jgi:hypothetical protein
MNDYILSRGVRDFEYEEWNYYFSKNDEVKRINKVIIFFNDNVNKIYLLVTSKEDLEDREYLNEVINLVHDLPTDFNLITEYVDDSDDRYLEDKVVEIRTREKCINKINNINNI